MSSINNYSSSGVPMIVSDPRTYVLNLESDRPKFGNVMIDLETYRPTKMPQLLKLVQ
jgi:hypothetical protein